MQIVADQATEQALRTLLEERMSDAVIVDINSSPDGAKRSDNPGLDFAIPLVKERNPLILLSFLGRSQFNRSYKFHYLVGHMNCEFLRLPVGRGDFEEVYEDLRYRLSPDPDDEHEYRSDELCLSLLDLRDPEDEQRTLRTLHHDLHHARTAGSKLGEWLERARRAGYSGTNEEVIAEVEADKLSLSDYAPFEGRCFPGTFVDLEGTLLVDDTLNEEVLWWVRHRSRGHVTLWTGGNADKLAETCRRHKLPWKVLSKNLFRGASVQYALDDISWEELRESYGITAEDFRQF